MHFFLYYVSFDNFYEKVNVKECQRLAGQARIGCINVSKVKKVYVFPPEYHYLGQACLKIAKILKINAHLEVAKVIQS